MRRRVALCASLPYSVDHHHHHRHVVSSLFSCRIRQHRAHLCSSSASVLAAAGSATAAAAAAAARARSSCVRRACTTAPSRTTLRTPRRHIATDGRVSNEDRRWWLLHLECAPDITAGTFVAWLDCCGTHTTKKLIERNVWTIEQVAELDSDQVDELKYKEGCLKMDIVWEHARTIVAALRQRQTAAGPTSELHSRIAELRRRRELERHREELLKQRAAASAQRDATLQTLRDAIAAKKAALRHKLAAASSTSSSSSSAAAEGNVKRSSNHNNDDDGGGADEAASETVGGVVERLGTAVPRSRP